MKLIYLYIKYFVKRLVFIGLLILLFSLFFILYKPEWKLFDIVVTNPYFNTFGRMPKIIYLPLVASIIFSTLTVYEILFSFVYSIYNLKITKRKNYIHKLINESIFEYLTKKSITSDDKKYAQNLGKILKSDYARLIFLNRLRRISLLTTGEVKQHCTIIINELNYNKLLKLCLKSPYAKDNLLALKIIGDLRLTGHSSGVDKLLKSKNPTIKTEALNTYLKTNEQTDLSFLYIHANSLSILDFNNIINTTAHYKNIDYRKLIESNIPFLSALGLRLIAFNSPENYKQLIIKQLDSEYNWVREEAFLTFLDLKKADSDFEILTYKFERFPNSLKTRAIDKVANFSDKTSVNKFLNWLIENNSLEIKFLAMKKIFEYDMSLVLKYKAHEDSDVRNTFNQLIDFNI